MVTKMIKKSCTIKAIRGDNSENVAKTVKYCKKNGISKLVLEKGEYHFYPELAAEAQNCCVSNHGHNGFRRTAFLIEDMKSFEIDASGSLLVFHGAMNAVIARRCGSVTVKNASILYERTNHAAYRVVESCGDHVDIEPCGERQFVYENGLLYHENEQGMRDLVYSCLEKDPATQFFATGEQCFGNDFLYHKNANITGDTIRIYAPERKPAVGNAVILIAAERYANALLAIDCSDVTFADCCVYRCYGIAYMAQKCGNVTLKRCRTDNYKDNVFSANADASHFVGCFGKIVIDDCDFRYQLDDGVNIHGVFTRILKVTDNSLIVRYSHYQCRGIRTFDDGCTVSVLSDGSLIPYMDKTVLKVNEINTECTELVLKGGTGGIREGDIIDSIDFYPEVLIENSCFADNRGRGILIGSKRKSVIRNNYFRVNGTAVLLESDCSYWYESGGAADLLIEGNVFEKCIYTDRPWGDKVIYTVPRAFMEKNKYYHGKIVIRDNDFSSSNAPAVDIGNVRYLSVSGNRFGDAKGSIRSYHCGNVPEEGGGLK